MSQEQDSLTFDKVVGSSRPTFVRFDQEYPVAQQSMARARAAPLSATEQKTERVLAPHLPFLFSARAPPAHLTVGAFVGGICPRAQYGEANSVFEKLALNASGSELLVCSVGISEYSEYTNKELGKRFGVDPENKDSWPVYMVFAAGSQEGVTYNGDKLNADEIRQFVRKQGVYIGLEGCSGKGDALAKEFMADKAKRKDLLAQAEKLAVGDSKEGTAKWYGLVMKKVLEKGDGFIASETARLLKVLEQGGESLKQSQAKLFKMRLNILSSFA